MTGRPEPYALIQEFLRRLLVDLERYHRGEEASILGAERKGLRVVNSDHLPDGSLVVLDWRSESVIARSDAGDFDEIDDAARSLDPAGKWIHVDRLTMDLAADEVETPDGLPESVAGMVQDWFDSYSSTDEDVAWLSGWPLADVKRCRRSFADVARGKTTPNS